MRAITNATKAWLLVAALTVLTIMVYRPGLEGGFLFDDFPNIVDNPGVQPPDASIPNLVRVAMSSPSSEFKRPLASLTFAANYLASGNAPFWMKATNLVIHVLNGWLVFLVARSALRVLMARRGHIDVHRGDISAALVAGTWLLLPINLTAVLYVVQRMESLANLFVLLGLLGYLKARQAMQVRRSFLLFAAAAASLIVPTILGALAKETAVMLPLYALVVECILFGANSNTWSPESSRGRWDRKIHVLFAVVLWIPMTIGLMWLLPGLLRPAGWSTRDFTMSTRLLTEGRVVIDYIVWTLLPSPGGLSFYHDDLEISRSLASPWTTLSSLVGIVAIVVVAWLVRRKIPNVSLGLGFYLAGHVLTATILPLELVYEHRNYFASFGLLLAVIPLLAQPSLFATSSAGPNRFSLIGPTCLFALLILWTGLTAITSYAWGNPLRLARELAARAPESPRAQYELGRAYVIYSRYDAASPFTALAYPPLEKAASLPKSGILPEQALVFFNARLRRPIKEAWWASMENKLEHNKVTVQDESALSSLVQCDHTGQCELPPEALTRVFLAALTHPTPSARLMAIYGDFAWNRLNDRALGQRMLEGAVRAKPDEPAYRITLIRMLIATGALHAAREERAELAAQNIGGALDEEIASVDKLLGR
jgi:hypothetical protein